MRVLIYGAGAIGTYFGYRLSQNNDVILVTRNAHAKAINTFGLQVRNVDGTMTSAEVLAIEALSELDTSWVPDIAIVTTKAYATRDSVDDLLFHFEDEFQNKMFHLLLLQNGLDNEEIALKVITNYNIDVALYRCLTSHGVIYVTPGEIHHMGEGKNIIGLYKIHKASENKGHVHMNDIGRFDLKLTMMFAACGLKVRRSTDIKRDIWIKGIINSTINPLTAILGVRNGELNNQPLRDITMALARESYQVASSLNIYSKGFPTFNEIEQMIFDVIENTANNRSSMLQDIERGRKTEIDHINGAIIKEGEKLGIDTRLNRMVYLMIKFLEKKV